MGWPLAEQTEVMNSVNFLSGLSILELGGGIASAAAGATLQGLGGIVSVLETDRHYPGFGSEYESDTRAYLSYGKGRIAGHEWPDALSGVDIVLADRVSQPTLGLGDPVDPSEYCTWVAKQPIGCWTTISAFGLTGTYADYLLDDFTCLAAGGMLAAMPGFPEDLSVPMGAQALVCAGRVAALAALHGLEERRGTSKPVHVDVSAQEAAIAVGLRLEMAHTLFNCPGRPGEMRHPPPTGTFQCTDGYIRIMAVEAHQWRGVVEALRHPEWASGIDSAQDRFTREADITREVTRWTRVRTKSACAQTLQSFGVPATPVNEIRELTTSAQYAARGFLHRVEIQGAAATIPGVPFRLSNAERPKGHVSGAPTQAGRLRGLRIREATGVLAGPLACSLLGAMGADVVRLEDPERLDLYRRSGPFADGVAGIDRGAYFAVNNHDKRSLVSVPRTQEWLTCLAEADVIVENLGVKRSDYVGIGAADNWWRDRPRLLVRSSGLGRGGPDSEYRAYGQNLHAYAGLMAAIVGWEGRPRDLGTSWADPLTGFTLATIIAAWGLGPARTEPIEIDVSMAEVVSGNLGGLFLSLSADQGRLKEAPLADRTEIRGIYEAVDAGLLAVSTQLDTCETFLVRHSGFKRKRAVSLKHDIQAGLVAFCGANTVAHAFDEFQRAGIFACPAFTSTALSHDGHLDSRDFFVSVANRAAVQARLVGLPWRFADADGRPELGSWPCIDGVNT